MPPGPIVLYCRCPAVLILSVVIAILRRVIHPVINTHPMSGKNLLCAVLVALILHLGTSSVLAVPGPAEWRASHRKMVQVLGEIAVRSSSEHPYLGNARARRFRTQLEALSPAAPARTRSPLHFQLGMAELYLGNERSAIDHLSRAYQLFLGTPNPHPGALGELSFRLGLAYLRLGETQNCCLRSNPDSCILPIRDGGIHEVEEGSRKAIEYFTLVLQNASVEMERQLAARWLLNIAYMTLGQHPDAVPAAHLIPPEAFESEGEFPRFTNIAPQLGLDTFSGSGGAVAEDFNNDGYLDLMVSNWDTSGQIRFFANEGDGTFFERTREAGLEGLFGGLNMVQADYDNDGNIDLLVLRGAWSGRGGRHPNSLLHNNGDGTFADVTFAVGLGEVYYPTQTAAWADYDNDGDVDLYVGNESTEELSAPCQLFRNNGDGTFVDLAALAGVRNLRFAKAVVWGDYDGDRFPDLYVSNLNGFNRLYHNNGDGTFIDVAPTLGLVLPKASFPGWFWDFDNDGNLDLLVFSYAAGIEDLAASHLGLPFDAEPARLYHGDGRGGFAEVAAAHNLVRPSAPMGSNFGDIDGDGYLDFYLGTGDVYYEDLMPNVLYRNQAGERFADLTTAAGLGHLQKGHGVAFADLDNDGDQEVFEQMGGAYPGDKFGDSLYENPGFGNRWLTLKLVGVRSNRAAIGARIRVDVVEGSRSRAIYKYVNSGGTFGANPLRQTIGLGRSERVERLEIFWPTSGEIQVFEAVPLNAFLQIVEGERDFVQLPLQSFSFAQGRPGE